MAQKSFQELDLSNGFLFSAALEDTEVCQLTLECILERYISGIKVRTEYNVLFSTDIKCIRLDVLGQDEMEVSYNLEMQNDDEKNLPKRSRYYQAELDLSSLKPGEKYQELKPLFVIFICNFDPFGEKLYRYTFEMQCVERCFPLDDGVKRIFLNTKGENKDEVSETLVEFLGYLNDSTDSYVEGIKDPKIRKIHDKVKELKKNHNLEERYMRFEELMQEREDKGREEGKELGRTEEREILGKLIQSMSQNGETELIPKLFQDNELLQSKLIQYNI